MTARSTVEEAAAAVELVRRYGGAAQASKATGIPRSTIRHKVDAARRYALEGVVAGPPIPEIGQPPEGFIVHRNSAQYDAAGNVQKQWVGTKRDAGEIYEAPQGHMIKGESALLDADGRVMQRWVKTKEGSGEGFKDALLAAFAEYQGAAPLIPEPVLADDDTLTEYPVPDLHLGAYAWGKETGENYDVKIAVDVATRGIQDLVSQSRPSSHAVLLFLGDYTHANDEKAVTPGSGHRLDVDGRWAKVAKAAARLAVSLVNIVAQKHQHVAVRVLKGNHDPDAAVCLAVALGLFFESNPRITIEDDPGIFWFRRFGNCLLGATHGHTMRADAMAQVMAVDRPIDWGQSVYRHIAYGHIHHETCKEVMGVRVESFQAVAARDSFNADHGYRSGRSLSAITWHRERGEIGRHRVNIGGRSVEQDVS